jgi:hypothetical protein
MGFMEYKLLRIKHHFATTQETEGGDIAHLNLSGRHAIGNLLDKEVRALRRDFRVVLLLRALVLIRGGGEEENVRGIE